MKKYCSLFEKTVKNIIFIAFIPILLISMTSCTIIQSNSYYHKANQFYQKKQYMPAFFFARKALYLSHSNFEYASLLAWSSLKLGRIIQANYIISSFEKDNANHIIFIQLKAWIEYSLGNDDISIQWFQKQIQWADANLSKKDSLYLQSIRSDAYYGLGLIKTRSTEYESARNYLQKALLYENQFIGHRPITIAHADTFYLTGSYNDALNAYQLISHGENEGIHIKIAWCLYYLKKYRDAELFLRPKLYQSPNTSSLLYPLFFSLFMQGKKEMAKNYLKQLIEISPEIADNNFVWDIINHTKGWQDLSIQLADSYYKKGYFLRASKIIKKTLETKPNHCQAKQLDSWCELYQSHALIALSQFNQLAVDPSCDNMLAILGQGATLLYLGYFQDAQTYLNKIPKESSYYFRAQMAKAGIDYLTGQFRHSTATYSKNKNRLFEKNDQFWPYIILNTLGWSYVYENNYQQAENIFGQLNGKSNYLEGIHLFGLAWVKLKQGKIDDAVSVLLMDDHHIRHDTLKQSVLLASAFYYKGDYHIAIDIFEKLLSSLPKKELFFSWGSFALQHLGWCYIYSGQYQKALDIFIKLKAYHPSPIYFASYANLGWGYYYMGMMEQAQKEFNVAKKIVPNNQMIIKVLQKIRKHQRSN